MKKLLALVALLVLPSLATAFQPRTGLWYKETESGDGFNIEIQNGVLVLTVYSYEGSGDSEWYLASGPMTNGNHTFTATLDKYRNGRCISCSYTGRPTLVGNDGVVTINFTSETAATITLPGGRTTAIAPYDFGYGPPPSGLLGEWVFFYDIISTFVERFKFTGIGAPTSTGNGVATDIVENCACEYKTSGTYAGYVYCADFDSSLNNVQNQYRWRYGIEETYSGSWISTTTGNLYSMKGLRTAAPNGSTRALAETSDALASLKQAEDARRATRIGVVDAETSLINSELREALVAAKARR